MTPVLLVGMNFLRENRWAVIVLMMWVVGSGAAAALTAGASADDALFFLKQQAVYGIVFTGFLAASAIYNQRRSRRILTVLSKGIDRPRYLAGLVLGYACTAGLYCAGVGITGAWTFFAARANPAAVWPLVAMLMAASLLSGTVALFFSTFLNPLFTIIATGAVLGAGGTSLHVLGGTHHNLLPVFDLMASIMDFSFQSGRRADWPGVGYAILESLLFWALASWVFSRRDIAVAVE